MAKLLIFFIIAAACNGLVFAQDERDIRRIMLREVKEKLSSTKEYPDWFLKTPFIALDLTEDKKEEFIQIQNRDGVDWIEIFNHDLKSVYEAKFQAWGGNAKVYKIGTEKLSNKTLALMLHYYEGHREHATFQGTARLYMLTIDNNNLKTAKMTKGPLLFQEFKGLKNYNNRYYKMDTADLDGDGVNEVSVKYGTIVRSYDYLGDGKWREI